MSSRWYPGNSGDIFPKAWFQHLLRESTSSWLQERFVHHTIGGIALGSKKRFRSRSYRAYRRNGCSLASPPMQNVEPTFPRDSRSLPTACRPWMSAPTARITNIAIASATAHGSRGSRHLSHWRGFPDVFLHVHAKSWTRTRCVTSRWTDLPWTIWVGHCHDRPLLQRCDFSTGCIVRHAPATASEFKSGKIPTFFLRDPGCFRIHGVYLRLKELQPMFILLIR